MNKLIALAFLAMPVYAAGVPNPVQIGDFESVVSSSSVKPWIFISKQMKLKCTDQGQFITSPLAARMFGDTLASLPLGVKPSAFNVKQKRALIKRKYHHSDISAHLAFYAKHARKLCGD